MIDKLKENNLYDESHPYFVADSPFYLSTSEECYQEVPSGVEPMSEEGLSFYEINWSSNTFMFNIWNILKVIHIMTQNREA